MIIGYLAKKRSISRSANLKKAILISLGVGDWDPPSPPKPTAARSSGVRFIDKSTECVLKTGPLFGQDEDVMLRYVMLRYVTPPPSSVKVVRIAPLRAGV